VSNAVIDQAEKVLAHTYKRFPLLIARGEGCTLFDDQNNAYTDFVAGIAVCNLGHAHSRVAAAIERQVKLLVHVSNLYYTQPQVALAQWLVDNCFADRVFFCNSGAEANEAAIKLARKYFKENGQPDRYRIISAKGSFHGRTMATLSATGQEKIRKGFDPLLEGFDFIAFNDLAALEAALGPDTAAVLLEPVQGEGGVNVPDADYLAGVRRLCDAAGALLIFDEIQTGMGRTGKLFAHQHFNAAPDIMTLAKALANGLPIGAMLVTEKAAQAFVPGSHASTFGGTPLVTAAALEVTRVMDDQEVPARAAETGAHIMARLAELTDRFTVIKDVRGLGLMIGIELRTAAAPIVEKCLARGFLINAVQENTIRLIPPLIIGRASVDALVDCLFEIFEDMEKGNNA
jgi:acetylornithine aminotransferase